MAVLPDGIYQIQGPNNLSLQQAPGTTRPTIEYVGPNDPWAQWEVCQMNDHGGLAGGVQIINVDSRLRLAAARPHHGGEPMMPPDQGSSVVLVPIGDADDYALWIPGKTSGPNGELCLTNWMSYSYSTSDPSLVLNVAGDPQYWTAGGNVIVWPWSGGEPNEIWWFQPVSAAV